MRLKRFVHVSHGVKLGGLLLSTALLMTHAFVNGYPIVYSDTSTYLASGFGLQTPFDRPITYGLFLALTSGWGWSLWPVVAAQSFLLAFLIREVVAYVLEGAASVHGWTVLIIAFLTVGTGVSWVSSQLIPDVFTPVMILSMVLILLEAGRGSGKVLFYVIFTLACAMHMGHLSLSVVLLLLVFLAGKLSFSAFFRPRLLHIVLLLGLTIATVFTMGSALGKSRHAFLMGAMVEHGIAQAYLAEHCGARDFALCTYKDELPDRAWVFLWDEASPFHKVGGWKGTKEEFNEIIYGTLTDPAYVWLHVKASLRATWEQLRSFRMGDGNGPFVKGTLLHERIANHVPRELHSYESARQNRSGFAYIRVLNAVQEVVVVLSLLLLGAACLWNRHWPSGVKAVVCLLILGWVANAWVNGTFANAIDRLGLKAAWLLPFAVLLIFTRWQRTMS